VCVRKKGEFSSVTIFFWFPSQILVGRNVSYFLFLFRSVLISFLSFSPVPVTFSHVFFFPFCFHYFSHHIQLSVTCFHYIIFTFHGQLNVNVKIVTSIQIMTIKVKNKNNTIYRFRTPNFSLTNKYFYNQITNVFFY
jgi:hypothetical protein